MPDDGFLSGVFQLPFPEQIAAFRLRLGNLVPTARWDEIEGQAHDRAFMVAGAVKADLLADLAAAVDRGIAEGRTPDDFRKDFRAIVERHGWHGWTGEGTKAGEAWRTRVIWRTNMATTYAAGRRAQLEAGNFAFWVYRHGGSREPRPEHLAWDGLVLPPGHPFWATHSPPNGWGCSCRIFGARSARGARRLGGDPDKPLPPGWDARDPRTGAPPGIDRGWAHAPGATVAGAVRDLAGKAVNWDYSLAVAFMRGLPPATRDAFSAGYRALPGVAEDMRRWAGKVALATGGGEDAAIPSRRTLGLATAADAARIEAAAGVAIGDALYDYAVDRDAVRHALARHSDPETELARGQRPLRPGDFGRLAALFAAPDSVEPADARPGRGPALTYRKRFGTEEVVALVEVRTGRRRLALVSMWVRIIAGASPPLTP